MRLIVENKNYSTWSMRPWVFMRAFGVDFEEVPVSLSDVFAGRVVAAPTRCVPVLEDGEGVVWDSLAICDYVSRRYLAGGGWPADVAGRARAMALVAEMHSGFGALRRELPMNVRARRWVVLGEEAVADVRRVDEIWAAAGEGWLGGEAFGGVDCFYAPVAMRFVTYGAAAALLSEAARRYWERLRGHAAVRAWCAGAAGESEGVEADEVGVEVDEWVRLSIDEKWRCVPGVGLDLPFIYFIKVVSALGHEYRYKGSGRSRLGEYGKNVCKILCGCPRRSLVKRDGTPQSDGNVKFRYVHLVLAKAVEEGWRIECEVVANCAASELDEKERFYVSEYGCNMNGGAQWFVEEFGERARGVV